MPVWGVYSEVSKNCRRLQLQGQAVKERSLISTIIFEGDSFLLESCQYQTCSQETKEHRQVYDRHDLRISTHPSTHMAFCVCARNGYVPVNPTNVASNR